MAESQAQKSKDDKPRVYNKPVDTMGGEQAMFYLIHYVGNGVHMYSDNIPNGLLGFAYQFSVHDNSGPNHHKEFREAIIALFRFTATAKLIAANLYAKVQHREH